MLKKITLATTLSVALASALSANVVKSNDGLGDFLIAPLYKASGNVCTEVRVTNTNETNSILAKVAFREKISSQEVDLPIFLSPGDVWSGTVCNEAGKVTLRSTDDSNHPKALSILTTGKDLNAQSKASGHDNVDFSEGYVEIYPIAEYNEGSKNKVQKSVLVQRWDNLIAGNLTDKKLSRRGVDGYSLTGEVLFKTGYQGIVTSTQEMTAFKGAHEKQLTGSVISYGNDTSPEVLLGMKSKQQILKLLQSSTVAFTYDNSGQDQYITLTYPFGYTDGQARKYKVIVRDMQENKDVKEETVIFSPAPVKKSQAMYNEVATISVSDIIAQTTNPAMFSKGQIQIQDITNITNVQLGAGKKPSMIATYVRQSNINTKDRIIDTKYAVTKK